MAAEKTPVLHVDSLGLGTGTDANDAQSAGRRQEVAELLSQAIEQLVASGDIQFPTTSIYGIGS